MKFKIFISLGVFVIIVSIIASAFYLKESNENSKYLTIFGNVDIRQVDLGFRVFGKVKSLYFEEGDIVQPNQLLAILDDVPYKEDLNITKAKVEEAQNAYNKSKAKFQKRYLTDPEAISKEEYDDAYFNLQEVKALLQSAKDTYERALTNLNDTKLFCPTDGVILTRIREPGSVLNPGDPVFTVSISSPIWIRAYIAEPDLGKIYFGMQADVFTDTEGLKAFKGHVGFISPVAEFTPKNVESLDLRTDLVYRIRVYVDDPNHYLKQGMPVTVKFDLK